jgi:soluble lytic murein transglycosylase-like protein
MKSHSIVIVTAVAALASLCPPARAAEHITLRSGAEFDCTRHEPAGDRVRLYLVPTTAAHSDENYLEVSAASVLRVDIVPDRPIPAPAVIPQHSPAGIPDLLAHAGAQHDIDSDLLASIVHAESNGNVRAVSRAGARGLMQLMPATASILGVENSFAPDQNISGGTTYLDQLLTRYHDDIKLAVAAYNAGPAAVDRYHGIPPFAETRAYVARVIREFNRRKREAAATIHAVTTSKAAAPASLIAAN